MIEQVNYVSQKISLHWSNKHIDKVQFNKDLIYLTDYKNFVGNYLFQKKLMHKSAGKLLDKQQNMLHSLNEKVRNYLFNNNFIELRQIEQNKSQNSLNYFIYLKQPLYLNTNNIKEIDLNTILKLSSFEQTREKNFVCESVDILNDGSYFFNFFHKNLSSNKLCTYFSIFEPVSRRILKEKLMDNIYFWN